MNLGAERGVIGVGIDLVEVTRFSRALERHPLLAQRLFTDAELGACNGAFSRLAVRFAAKEAAMKALGVGMGKIGWHDVSIVTNVGGAPSLIVVDRAAALAHQAGGTRWLVSLTHSGPLAQAFVVLCSS